jgi:hypothetical protein
MARLTMEFDCLRGWCASVFGNSWIGIVARISGRHTSTFYKWDRDDVAPVDVLERLAEWFEDNGRRVRRKLEEHEAAAREAGCTHVSRCVLHDWTVKHTRAGTLEKAVPTGFTPPRYRTRD